MILNHKVAKLMEKVRKHVRYYDTSTGKGNFNDMHDKYLYKVEYPDGTTEKLADIIIDENMLL